MKDKSVLVTGASAGCGKAMVLSFARAGVSRIALLARRDMTSLGEEISALAESSGLAKPQLLLLRVDQTVQSQVEDAAKQVEREFGGSIDVVVNNAGHMETWSAVTESSPEAWWRTWEVNLKGPYLISRSFIPLLLRSTTKILVQMTSMGALATKPGASAYQGTKSALMRLSNHLRHEYGGQGLLIHNLHPGAIRTNLSLTMPSQVHGLLVDMAELCGETVVWLTCERREWLQDRFISAQWDMASLEARKDEIVSQNLLRMGIKYKS